MNYRCSVCDKVSTAEEWDAKTNEMYPPEDSFDTGCETVQNAYENDEMSCYGFACPKCSVFDGEPSLVDEEKF